MEGALPYVHACGTRMAARGSCAVCGARAHLRLLPCSRLHHDIIGGKALQVRGAQQSALHDIPVEQLERLRKPTSTALGMLRSNEICAVTALDSTVGSGLQTGKQYRCALL